MHAIRSSSCVGSIEVWKQLGKCHLRATSLQKEKKGTNALVLKQKLLDERGSAGSYVPLKKDARAVGGGGSMDVLKFI